MTGAIKPAAYAFRHSYGKTTLHPAEEYATAYRDTCVGIDPLYTQAAIHAAVAAERADAERYRFLRDSPRGMTAVGSLVELWQFSRPTASASAIDAAIDAARASKGTM